MEGKKSKTKMTHPQQQVKRVFVHPAQISKHLYCSICADVFNDAVRLNCLHTFCNPCITQWIDNQKSASSCPYCRVKIDKKKITKDILACKIINDLEIFCSNRMIICWHLGCSWKGPLQDFEIHIKNCRFQEDKLPQWYTNYLKSKEQEFQLQEQQDEYLDAELLEQINQEVPRETLAMRLFNNQNGNCKQLQSKNIEKLIGMGSDIEEEKEETKNEFAIPKPKQRRKTKPFNQKKNKKRKSQTLNNSQIDQLDYQIQSNQSFEEDNQISDEKLFEYLKKATEERSYDNPDYEELITQQKSLISHYFQDDDEDDMEVEQKQEQEGQQSKEFVEQESIRGGNQGNKKRKLNEITNSQELGQQDQQRKVKKL